MTTSISIDSKDLTIRINTNATTTILPNGTTTISSNCTDVKSEQTHIKKRNYDHLNKMLYPIKKQCVPLSTKKLSWKKEHLFLTKESMPLHGNITVPIKPESYIEQETYIKPKKNSSPACYPCMNANYCVNHDRESYISQSISPICTCNKKTCK